MASQLIEPANFAEPPDTGDDGCEHKYWDAQVPMYQALLDVGVEEGKARDCVIDLLEKLIEADLIAKREDAKEDDAHWRKE